MARGRNRRRFQNGGYTTRRGTGGRRPRRNGGRMRSGMGRTTYQGGGVLPGTYTTIGGVTGYVMQQGKNTVICPEYNLSMECRGINTEIQTRTASDFGRFHWKKGR
jgi:hypothetical protein